MEDKAVMLYHKVLTASLLERFYFSVVYLFVDLFKKFRDTTVLVAALRCCNCCSKNLCVFNVSQF